MTREEVLCYAAETYGSEAAYLFAKYPDVAVLRHRGNRKWYAVVMRVSGEKLGIPAEMVDILNVKVDPLMVGSLQQKAGIFPAYHMNKTHWVSVLLDETSVTEETLALLAMSYQLTKAK